jgi:hypothetical protein
MRNADSHVYQIQHFAVINVDLPLSCHMNPAQIPAVSTLRMDGRINSASIVLMLKGQTEASIARVVPLHRCYRDLCSHMEL